MADTDSPRATYNKKEILSNAGASNGILSILRDDILKKGVDASGNTDWQIGRIVITIYNMDPLMKYAYDDKDADGNVIQHYDTKLLDCKLYGRATLYERDLELGNVFEATTQGVGGKQYKYSATDYGRI